MVSGAHGNFLDAGRTQPKPTRISVDPKVARVWSILSVISLFQSESQSCGEALEPRRRIAPRSSEMTQGRPLPNESTLHSPLPLRNEGRSNSGDAGRFFFLHLGPIRPNPCPTRPKRGRSRSNSTEFGNSALTRPNFGRLRLSLGRIRPASAKSPGSTDFSPTNLTSAPASSGVERRAPRSRAGGCPAETAVHARGRPGDQAAGHLALLAATSRAMHTSGSATCWALALGPTQSIDIFCADRDGNVTERHSFFQPRVAATNTACTSSCTVCVRRCFSASAVDQILLVLGRVPIGARAIQ